MQLIYLFLVEKAVCLRKLSWQIHRADQEQFIIRGGMKPRLRSKMWVFNAFGMLGKFSQILSHIMELIHSHLIRSIQHCHNSEFYIVSLDPIRTQIIDGMALTD